MADVFLSYARQDEAAARRAAKVLTNAGLDVWWDAELPAHRAYSDVIQRNLEDARAVVVLWSANSAKSQWVRAEADFARNAGTLVQAQLDRTMPPIPFNQIQCAPLKGWRGSASHPGWSKLQASVQALVSGEEKPAATQDLASWDRLLQYRWWGAAIAALVIVAGASLLWFARPGEQRKPVVAVLPFTSLDSEDASLVAGMWDDTRQAIGRNPQLIVLGPNTVQALALKGEQAAGKAADYLVQASVRTAGDRIRVSADLVRTKDGEQVWSQDFDRKLDDVFALQSDIASQIEGRIRGRLADKGGVTPEHIATTGEAYALYSDARAKIRKRDYTRFKSAFDELRRVVALDPNYAPAWASLAVVVGAVPPSERDWKLATPSEAYARKAVDLAPNLAAGHAALAFSLKLEGPVARAEVDRAVALDPNDYEAVSWLGNMRSQAGDKSGAIEAYRKAAELEPFFWPAVLNLYGALEESGDRAGVDDLLAKESRVGADYLAASVEMERAYDAGDLGRAANIGLRSWVKGQPEAQSVIGGRLWAILLELGYLDQAANMGPGPDFAPDLWKLDPRGLDILESHKIDPRTFFALGPLTENAARVYLLSGRGRRLADMYLSLKVTPEEYRNIAYTDGPEHFLYCSPLIALALQGAGHSQEADALLRLAESKAGEQMRDGKPLSAILLARVYAAEGRKENALPLLTAAVARRWLPAAPELLADLDDDPALSTMKGDPRFQRVRQQILDTIDRQRARVDKTLLARFRPAV